MWRRAAAEACLLGIPVVWMYMLLDELPTLHSVSMLQSLYLAVGVMAALVVGGALVTLVGTTSTHFIRQHAREEVDSGILIGVAIVPIVLGSRLLLDLTSSVQSDYTLSHLWLSLVIGTSSLVRVSTTMPWSVTSGIVESILLHGLCIALQVPPNMFLVHVHIALHLYNVLLQYGLAAVSRSFTYGEAMVIAQGMTFLTLDAVLFTLHQGSWLRPSSYPVPQRDGIAIILQVGLVLSMLLLPLLCTPLFHTYGTSTPRIVRPTLPAAPTAHFAGLLVIVAIMFIVWTSFLLHMPLWKWMVDTLLVPSKVGVAAYWLGVLAVAVPCCPIVATRFKLRQIVARKLYHVMVVLLFLPVSFVDVDMLRLSYGVAVGVFIVLECVRAMAVPPFGRSIALYMRDFLDHRDQGRVVLSHTYLLVGCALPLWILFPTSSTFTNLEEHHHQQHAGSTALIANAGVLALGIGDAMGAAVGSSYGATKVVGHKSLEGSAAMVVSMCVVSVVCHSYHWDVLAHSRYAPAVQWLGATVATATLEAVTCQIDNLVLPLYYCALCCLTACSH